MFIMKLNLLFKKLLLFKNIVCKEIYRKYILEDFGLSFLYLKN